MAVNTILLDFSVNPVNITKEGECRVLLENFEQGLRDFIPDLKRTQFLDFDGGFILILTSERGVLATVRGYKEGIVTCNIEHFRKNEEKPLLTYESSHVLESALYKKLNSWKSNRLPAVKRGDGVLRYFPSSDERILEYDIDEVVYDERSPYQKIQIVHSKTLGNLLVLDDLQNMSESDLIYTETLMQRGKENYRDKEIVILGGGDGALLYELLKEKPKFVTMLEIDELVMKACRKYLRSCCGDCLDKMKGDNYEIIVDDCVKVLKRFIGEGKKFDFVFGDLTDIPLSDSPKGEMWDFIRLILNLSMKVLKPAGKYMTHGNGVSCPESLRMYESQLSNLEVPVEFSMDHAFVPSFMEGWVFYQVWKKDTH